ncbi:MAG: hypothetical protein IJ060_00860 [Oscillospiraceae bacterium]|nr:hypothetical protein [Oscillospiraceae bacterium]
MFRIDFPEYRGQFLLINEDSTLNITDDGIDNADFNRDERLNMEDFRSIMRYLAGLPY